jgi:mRNA-degrading endonuclease toxin of MazEF toxin-antitoxin module
VLKGMVCKMDGWRGYVVVLSATEYLQTPYSWTILVAPIARQPSIAYCVPLSEDDPVSGYVALTDIEHAEREELSNPLSPVSPTTQQEIDRQLRLALGI